MHKYKPQHSRLLFIDRKIGECGYPNCSSLAEEWEVSSKTIQRDIDYMRYQLDAPLEYSAKHRGYYYTEENFNLPAISLKESDLFAIYLAEELLEQYRGTPLYNHLQSILHKIQDSLPDKKADISRQDLRFSLFPTPSTTIAMDIWQTVFDGLRRNRQLKLTYQTPGKEISKRTVDPYHAIRYEGDWYIVGHCHTRTRVLVFSMSRILSAVLTKEMFSIPEDFNFHKISRSRFGIHWGKEEKQVIIRFSPAIAHHILARQWHPSQEIRKNSNGSIDLSLTVDSTVELKRWVLGWGKEAKILSPPSLISQLQQEIEEMQKIYTTGEQ